MAEWQKIGGIEVCVGNDGVTGVLSASGCVHRFNAAGRMDSYVTKEEFEAKHCQPRHRMVECADGAVMVLSTEELDGKPRRGAFVASGSNAHMTHRGENAKWFDIKDEAIAAAVAYVTAR